ncbi:MAG: hypothetical protein LBK91_04495 [Synergistaceae bacterium]|jgi:hypothetical protein|nr:hypothetical protein [Synergistaceae bacterium]
MHTKKILIILSLAVTLFGVFPDKAFSSYETTEPSCDYSADLFSAGKGTNEDPFIVGSVEELEYMCHQSREGKYRGVHFALEKNAVYFFRSETDDKTEFNELDLSKKGMGTRFNPYILESVEHFATFTRWLKRKRYPDATFPAFKEITYFALETDGQDGRDSIAERGIDYIEDSFSGGSGTKSDPFIIDAIEELAYLAHHVRDKKYKGAHFLLKQMDGWLTSKNSEPVSDDVSAEKHYAGYALESPTRGTGTESDPYVFDSWEQMTCLTAFVRQGTYPYGENTHFALETENWLDFAASAYAGGDGSEESPFLIETAEQLALLATQVKDGDSCEDKHFKQTKDIDLSGKQWTPIGGAREYTRADLRMGISYSDGNYFSGDYDGGGRMISGLKITQFIHAPALFNILYNGVVKNLRLTKLKIAMGSNCGGIAAWMYKSKIFNCDVSGEISFLYNGGGIVYYADKSEITGCSADLKFYYFLHEFTSFVVNFDFYYIPAYGTYWLDDGELAHNPLVTIGNTFHLPFAVVGGIASWARDCLIKGCKVKAYFSSYSDHEYNGYYGGILGMGRPEMIVDCEAYSHSGEILSLFGDRKKYFKDVVSEH